MDSVLRFLEIVRRQLDAADAWVTLWGDPPEELDRVYVGLGGPWRLVVRFAEAPGDLDLHRQRLQTVVDAFPGVAAAATAGAPEVPKTPASMALEHTLETLRAVSQAAVAVIIDDSSPVIWGRSCQGSELRDIRHALSVADGAEASAADRTLARAIAAVHRWGVPAAGHAHGDGFGYVARRFGGVYALILAYDREFSEVTAEGALVRALPVIERLVAALPPIDPGPRGKRGRVIRLPRR